MIPAFLNVFPFFRGARGILFGFLKAEAFLGVIPSFLSVILAFLSVIPCDSGVSKGDFGVIPDEARRFVQRRLHRRGRLRVKDGSCMASWSVVREDLLRRWLDARNRARCGTYAAGGGARSRRPCSMCAAATPFVRLREAFLERTVERTVGSRAAKATSLHEALHPGAC